MMDIDVSMCREDMYAALSEYTLRKACDELVFKEKIDGYNIRNFVEEILVTTFKDKKETNYYFPVREVVNFKAVQELMDNFADRFKDGMIMALSLKIKEDDDENRRREEGQ